MSVDCDDSGEPIVVDTQRRVRARKEHHCDACRETVERGHLYVRHVVIWGGQVETTVRCLRCDAIYQALVVIHRTENEKSIEARRKLYFECRHDQTRLTTEERRLVDRDSDWPDIALNCGHEFKERWGVEPPPELARLAFMTQAEMQTEEQRQ